MTATEVLRKYKSHGLPEFYGIKLKDVNQRSHFGNVALHIAATRGNLEDVKALMEGGADINIRGEDGYSPLQDAVTQGKLEVVRLLLMNHADLSTVTDFGESALEIAQNHGYDEIVIILKSYL